MKKIDKNRIIGRAIDEKTVILDNKLTDNEKFLLLRALFAKLETREWFESYRDLIYKILTL